jgi:hypothetical protein
LEQKRSKVSGIILLGELGQFAAFAAFIAFSFYFFVFAYGTQMQGVVYFSLAIAIPLYAIALRLDSLRAASVSWLVLGVSLTASFAILNPSNVSTSSLELMILVILIIASTEQTRFSFAIDPAIHACRNYESEEEIAHLEKVIKNHALTLFQIIGLSILASSGVLYLSEGAVIVINPPIVGVTIIVALAVFLIASMGSVIFPRRDPDFAVPREAQDKTLEKQESPER